MSEGAGRLGDDLAAVQGEADEFPGVPADRHAFPAVAQPDQHFFFIVLVVVRLARGNPFHDADAAVDPAVGRVVADQHDLRARLEDEFGRGRIGLPVEVAEDLGAGDEPLGRQAGEFFGVDPVRVAVGGGQDDVELVGARFERRPDLFVQAGEVPRLHRVVANPIEQGDELGVLLAIDLFQFDDLQIRVFERLGAEEVGRVVQRAEDLALARGDDRRQLVEVADEHHLHAAERHAALGPVLAQERVDAVEQVGAQHGRLVDDDGFQALVEFRSARGAALLAHLLRRHVEAEAEEAVHRLPADVERRDAGRGEDDRLPFRRGAVVRQQRRFPGSGPAGDE